MADQPENPQAYPCLDDSGFGSLSMRDPGMTLRDYFAGQALAATDTFSLEGWSFDEMAEHFYGIADAMLRERGK